MTDQTVSLTLEKREALGKAVKNLRRAGQVPAVVHDHGKASLHVQAPYLDMYRIFQRAGKHHPVELTVGDKKYLALIKDATFEPRKNQLTHVVFNAVARDQKVEAEVPVVFTGDSEAEKAGLMLLRQIDVVEVEAIPSKLPDEITVDISGLAEVGDRLHVSDLVIPADVVLLTEPERAVAIVEESAAVQAAADEAAEAAEAAASATESGDEAAEGEEAKPADESAES